MARIAGVNIPTGKHLCIALTYIYGIGRTRAKKVLDATKIDPTRKVETLSEAELDLLRDELKKYIIEGDLRREVTSNIKILQEINSYPWHSSPKTSPSSRSTNQDQCSYQARKEGDSS